MPKSESLEILFITLLKESTSLLEERSYDLGLNKAFEAYFLLEQHKEIDVSIENQLETYIVLATFHSKTGNPQEGKILLRRALLISEGKISQNYLGRIYSLLAQFEILVSELDSALEHFEKAIENYEEVKNSIDLMKTLGNKAILLDMMGKRSEALETYIKVSTFFSENAYDVLHIIALIHIANIFEVMGSYRSSIANLSIAATLLSNNLNFPLQSRIKANLAYLYLLLGDKEASNEYLELARLDLEKTTNDDMNTVYFNIYKSEILKYNLQYQDAYKLALHTLEITEKNQFQGLTIQTCIDLANISLHLKNIESSEEYLNKAISLSHSNVYKTFMVNIYHTFAMLSNAKSELENALMYCTLGIEEARRQNLNPVLDELTELKKTLLSKK